MYVSIYHAVSWREQRAQALNASKQLLEYYQTFGTTENGTTLTFDRITLDLKSAAEASQAAMDTENKSIMDIWSAPPTHRIAPKIAP